MHTQQRLMTADIAVAGGGIAGYAAAIGAARQGFSVLLVMEQDPIRHQAYAP